MQDTIDALYEELIFLDEIAGELDAHSNLRTDQRRKEIISEIRELDSISSRWG